ncbi:MAG: NADH:ubiquinone reductase (Na(+)-transporting) subunit C [Waddliaceae bacterium]
MSSQQSKQGPTNAQVIRFIVILSFVCALVLSVVASLLKEPQEVAKELDRNQQMLIAARIFTHDGYFLMRNEQGEYIPAKHAEDGVLVPGSESDLASKSDIIDVYKKRLVPYLVDEQGNITTFEKTGTNKNQYILEYKKSGYYKQPLKLIYVILPNPKQGKPEQKEEPPIGYIIPVNGIGLWDAIYGYLAIEPDGKTIIGISWYEHKETPGLGANIADEPWQSQFHGKQIFLHDPSGEIDLKTAPLGIKIVKGKVAEVFGDTPKAKSAVDGIPGATLTGNSVDVVYRNVLAKYRPFLIKIHEKSMKSQQ